METALGGGQLCRELALPCGEPTEPQPMLQRLRAQGKRGTGKAWRVAQLLAQIGAGQPRALAQEAPPGLYSRPLCVGWAPWSLALAAIILHSTRGCGPFFAHHRGAARVGGPPLNPRVRCVGRARCLPALGLQLCCKSSPRKPLTLSGGIFSYHSAPFSYLASNIHSPVIALEFMYIYF